MGLPKWTVAAIMKKSFIGTTATKKDRIMARQNDEREENRMLLLT
jgi:hypothetical protein